MEETPVAKLSAIASGSSCQVEIDGERVALHNVDGEIFATSGSCPHQGGPLAEGDIEAGILTCPWHGWRFDIKTGECLTAPGERIACHKVKAEGDDIYVDTK